MTRTAFQKRCDDAWTENQQEALRFAFVVFRAAGELEKSRKTRLYVIRDEEGDAVKIGVGVDAKKRLSQLQIGNIRPLELIVHVPSYAAVEKLIHRWLREERLTGEWFRCSTRTLVICECLFSVADVERDVISQGDLFDADFALAVLQDTAEQLIDYVINGPVAA